MRIKPVEVLTFRLTIFLFPLFFSACASSFRSSSPPVLGVYFWHHFARRRPQNCLFVGKTTHDRGPFPRFFWCFSRVAYLVVSRATFSFDLVTPAVNMSIWDESSRDVAQSKSNSTRIKERISAPYCCRCAIDTGNKTL